MGINERWIKMFDVVERRQWLFNFVCDYIINIIFVKVHNKSFYALHLHTISSISVKNDRCALETRQETIR